MLFFVACAEVRLFVVLIVDYILACAYIPVKPLRLATKKTPFGATEELSTHSILNY